MAPPDTWNDNMVAFHEFVAMDEDDREGKFPFIWGVDKENRLKRIMCSQEIVKSAEERLQFWTQLKGLAGEINKVDVDALVRKTKIDMAHKLSTTLLSLSASGDAGQLFDTVPSNGGGNGGAHAAAAAGYEPVWIETPQCTACDECIEINPKMFAYNGDKLAVVIDPKAGSYKDVVRAAEKCTAGCIHPGTPWNTGEKDVDKLVKRAEKFQ